MNEKGPPQGGRLQDRVAIVTGGGKGIGRGAASVLAQAGAYVVVADVDDAAARECAQSIEQEGGRAMPVHCDVSDERQVEEMVDRTVAIHERIDVLVNNAGIGVYKTILDATPEDWDRCLGVDLKGVYLCCRRVVPTMQRQGKGAIVNVASVHAVQNVGATAPYAASKGGVLALTRTMAIDFARDGIRVNAVCPGWIDTPLIRGIFESSGRSAEMRDEVSRRQLLGRLGTPTEVGYAILYLACDESSYVTGASLFVDAGMTAQLETW